MPGGIKNNEDGNRLQGSLKCSAFYKAGLFLCLAE